MTTQFISIKTNFLKYVYTLSITIVMIKVCTFLSNHNSKQKGVFKNFYNNK